jgi:hypothetical protein
MKLSDLVKGQAGSAIASHLAKTTIIDVVEINGTSESQKKLDEIRQSINRTGANKIIVVAYKI